MNQPAAHFPTIAVQEWRTHDLKGTFLTDGDQPLVDRLRSGSNSRLSVEQLLDGLRITSRSWAGVVRFHEFELQIVPKLVGDNLGLVELIDYASGLDSLDRLPRVRTVEGSGTNLFDMIALLLVEACEKVVRGGLLSDYREIEDDLPVIRGRLLVKPQVLKRFGKIDRLECRYDEYLTDIVENRILLAALSSCVKRVVNPMVSVRARRMLAIFSEVCDLHDMNLSLVRSSLFYNRLNEHYREPHELAWMILDGLGIKDIYAPGSHRCFSFLLDMNRLFEAFVTRWLSQALPRIQFRVIPQHRDRTILWNADRDRPHAAVVPDLLIGHVNQASCFLPVDAKYKLYDERNIDSSDIYQTFLYAYAYGEQHSEKPTAIVVYPASSVNSNPVSLQIRRSNGKVSALLRVVPIHIPSALAEARAGSNGPLANGLVSLVQQALTPGSSGSPARSFDERRHQPAPPVGVRT